HESGLNKTVYLLTCLFFGVELFGIDFFPAAFSSFRQAFQPDLSWFHVSLERLTYIYSSLDA
ncbi:MAG TPA: hypothetical protein PLR25_17605, partial [Planctomycetaceae bacterium]|nr:hypothetical protein [Planctomycetaceae bacterium]